jgi:hypothetical protein
VNVEIWKDGRERTAIIKDHTTLNKHRKDPARDNCFLRRRRRWLHGALRSRGNRRRRRYLRALRSRGNRRRRRYLRGALRSRRNRAGRGHQKRRFNEKQEKPFHK